MEDEPSKAPGVITQHHANSTGWGHGWPMRLFACDRCNLSRPRLGVIHHLGGAFVRANFHAHLDSLVYRDHTMDLRLNG